MEKLKPLTPWQEKMAREVFARATAAGDPDPIGAVAQMMAESRMNPNVVSPAGAVGLAQFIPDTAARFGLKNPRDPSASIDAAIKYRKYIREYNAKQGVRGEDYVWAGYNAGEGRSVQARHGFSETRRYVSRINDYKPQLAKMLSLPMSEAAMSSVPPSGNRLLLSQSSSPARSRIQVAEDKFSVPSRETSPTPLRDAVRQMWSEYISELRGDPQA